MMLRPHTTAGLTITAFACITAPPQASRSAERPPSQEDGSGHWEEEMALRLCGEGAAAIGPARETYPTVQAAVGALAPQSQGIVGGGVPIVLCPGVHREELRVPAGARLRLRASELGAVQWITGGGRMAIRTAEGSELWLRRINFVGDGSPGRPITVEDGSLHLEDVTVERCASSASGGAILFRTRPRPEDRGPPYAAIRHLSMKRVEVTGCEAAGDGGVLAVEGYGADIDASLRQVRFHSSSSGGAGGMVHVAAQVGVELRITNSQLTTGSAARDGGIIAWEGYGRLQKLDVTSSYLVEGWAGGNGGLVSHTAPLRGHMQYSMFTSSQLERGHALGHGGAVSVDGHYAGGLYLNSCHVTANRAEGGAAAVHAADSAHDYVSLDIGYTSFSGNESLAEGGAVVELGPSVYTWSRSVVDNMDNTSPMFLFPDGSLVEHLSDVANLTCLGAGGCVTYAD